MNGRKQSDGIGSFFNGADPSLLICAVSFVIGIVFGIALAFFADSESDALAFIDGLSMNFPPAKGDLPSVFSLFSDLVLLPFIAAVSGFSLFGALSVPLCCLVKGLSLSYAFSLFVRVFGLGDPGFCLFLVVNALFYVPCFFAVCVDSFESSVRLAALALYGDRTGGLYGIRYFIKILLCAALMLVIAAAERVILINYFCLY